MSEGDCKIKTILVESDETARLAARRMISRYSRLELVKVFTNGKEAIQYLSEHFVDLLFLAVNLSDINAFQLLDKVKVPYPVIFTTADVKHAFYSFEYNVVDFLKKPINPDHFDRAVHRAMEKSILHNQVHSQDKKSPQMIEFPVGTCTVSVELDRILFLQSFGNYVKICADNQTVVASLSTQKVLEMLPPSQFLRVHRSFIVNKHKITSCDSKELTVGRNTIPIGISYRQSIKEKLGVTLNSKQSPTHVPSSVKMQVS